MKKPMVWLAPAGVLLAFLASAWAAGVWLQLGGRDLWILRGGLALLGLLAAALLFLYLRGQTRTQPVRPGRDEEMEDALAAAQKRLAASRLGRPAKLGKLPVVLLIGPSGSSKTTVLVRSGLEPELLAGEVHRGETVIPTEALNLWYAQDTVFVEVGGKVLEAEPRWRRLVRHLRPARLAAALKRGVQAPRLAVICFGCDEFLKPGANEAVPAAARRMRARLSVLSEELGIRLPVYVLFTKADRLPYFEDYVRSFSREEAQEVLGSTLRVPPNTPVASHAEQESARLMQAFDGILHSLSLRRLQVLPRETQEDVRSGAYEFPRELRKLSDLAVQFMVELCRPSQLSVSPFLRGFYFTGVRAVIVSDPGVAEKRASPAGPQISLGATSVFSANQVQAALRDAAPSQGSRKVPEWLFLGRIFREIVLRDEAAARITGGGARVNHLRRVGLATAAALFLLLAGAFTISYANNRVLERDAIAAAEGVRTLSVSDAGLPGEEPLRRLDALRAEVERIESFQRGRRPARFGWGLYTGDRIVPPLRQLYFDRFALLLWDTARTDLLATLQAVPDTPSATGDFARIYNSLKAHLVTTVHHQESTSAFLTPVLLDHWAAGRQLDSARAELVRRQFDFFGAELPFGNPYRDAPVDPLVRNTRSFLCGATDADQFYQMLVLDPFRAQSPLQFHQLVPGAEGVVRNGRAVPWQFTAPGWEAVQQKLGDVNQLFGDEDWVLGANCFAAADRARLAQALRERYVREYIQQWQDFLRAGQIVGAEGTAAAGVLARLASNQSPLFRLFFLASQNTDVDSVVAQAFAPVHTMVPPDAQDTYIGSEAAQAYIAKLSALQAELNSVAAAPSADMRNLALMQAANRAGEVRQAVDEIARGFVVAGDAPVAGQEVQRLLQQPVGGIEVALRGVPAEEANKAGESFCAPFRSVAARFPFRSGGPDADLDQVIGLFQPDVGALWQIESTLPSFVVRQGTTGFARHPSAAASPSAAFIGFLNAGARVSRGLFAAGGDPRMNFYLRLEPPTGASAVTITIDGTSRTFTPTRQSSAPFTWDGRSAQQLRVTVEGADIPPIERTGTWAVFRFFRDARGWQAQPDGGYRLEWTMPGAAEPLRGDVRFDPGAPAVLRGDFFNGLACPGRIVG
jgi:type VI secretion system protein ImpL